MKNKSLFVIWILYYFVCVAFACIPNPQGPMKGFSLLLGLLFFVPGGILLARFCKANNRKGLVFFRNLSLTSLGLTVLLILGNFMATALPETAGNVFHALLILVSVPMICCHGIWILSLFGWAIYLSVARYYLKNCSDPDKK
ncbi:MAG: hypothetical protein J6Q30_03785 [Oscillospiraceae bacterium]|nr:hypothetical protein [Oscillospiraceae bacterium]